MLVENLKLGQKIKVYLSDMDSRLLSIIVTPTMINATVIIIDTVDKKQPCCFGWKPGEPYPRYSSVSSPNQGIYSDHSILKKIDDLDSYTAWRWASANTMVWCVDDIGDGLYCAGGCRTFYPYAMPNQPDGTLRCFSCRTYPFYNSSADDDY